MSGIQNQAIAVLGAGSFGTALAILLAKNDNKTILWGRNPTSIANMKEKRVNQKYLPNIPLPDSLEITDDFKFAVTTASDILIATPSYAFTETLKKIKALVNNPVRIVWACKGLEPESSDFLDEKVSEIFGEDCEKAILAGPTFAEELAVGAPTAITLASNNALFAADLSQRLVNQTFRVYLSSDMKGVQFGGALKNIVAIGAGIADGLGFGSNARTALITRGLAEMMRMGEAIGGNRDTFTGMAGLGDLVLTCTDDQSRNRRFGIALGKGATVQEATSQIGQVVEGVRNTREVYHLAQKRGVDMPICKAIYSILYLNMDPRIAAKELLTRAMKVEGA
ncbi:MAG: NAD(P)-dependent glycerol-3-phosphate dehydrogenase [Gammaproteobacteria bacterium]|nr:NAD(P)-dependent glycerol-3-phosphate dehydrogenase [Gammaproteobacteria bacterium]MDH5628656.1 NAD(P)-dependent glycerol-3-phosphate dehydrogenase [Gammaproteobacteria bacterium]